MTRIFAIDPGTTASGWVWYDAEDHEVVKKGVTPNDELLRVLECHAEAGLNESVTLAIEMIASQGMAVGAEVFETVVWIGMFMHAWGYEDVLRLTRNQCKLHVCGSAKAKDANVRQALIDLWPATGGGKKEQQIGTAKQPGPLFGMNTHMWPALAVAVTAWDKIKKEKKDAPARPAGVGHALRRRARL